MYVNPFQVSLDTVIGTSTMLGHRLEDRARIRDAQDRSLVHWLQSSSTVALGNAAQEDLFAVAPLDILVSESRGEKQFHLLEINGTGIGGFTNLPGEVVSAVLEGLSQMAQRLPGPQPLVLVAISGKECDSAPRLNKLVHEKLLYVEALKRGFEYGGRPVTVTAMPHLLRDPGSVHSGRPTVVLGYIKDLVDNLALEADGRLSLCGRPVAAAVNDRFCLNVVEKFAGRVDLAQFATMNRCFLAGSDKGVAYALLNEFLGRESFRYLPDVVASERLQTREELVAAVLRWVRGGRRAVIKPQGTGLGHGIEFFLDPREPDEEIVRRIDGSVRLTEEYYHAKGGAFPYTVCEYVDSSVISEPAHPLCGHKYELRVVVYRDGAQLKAFPSIVKIASEAYDAAKASHLSLINNITTSAQAKSKDGCDYMLPLANRDTMKLLGLRPEHMVELCAFATKFIRHVLDKVQTEPQRLGLPAAAPAARLPGRSPELVPVA